MKLNKLSDGLNKKELCGSTSHEIDAITADSKKTGPGVLFVAIRGTNTDGHDFLEEAFDNGTNVFVTEKPFKKPGATNIIVPDSRSALAGLASVFYNNPSKDLTLIGITGTNGKTTTAFLIESILKNTGADVGLLSTIQYSFGTRLMEASHTTPGQLELQKILREMVDTGIKYAVMEVSSHGLQQKRAERLHFDTAVFTNLSPEHLDYHKTMADYLGSKEILFTELLNRSIKQDPAAVINTDDPSGRLLSPKIKRAVLSYGIHQGEVHSEDIDLSLSGIKLTVVTPDEKFFLHSKLIGRFNVYNILAAATAAISLGIPSKNIRAGIEMITAIPGRMETVENDKGICLFIDYAHTGDALENVLRTISSLSGRRIITIFGCGGDRDRGKRPVMGSIAARYSNIIFITSDNPRTEDPEKIMKEIETGVLKENFKKQTTLSAAVSENRIYFLIKDRRKAINDGISMAKPGDIVLIAGKGHETYQINGHSKSHFDDREEAIHALKMCA